MVRRAPVSSNFTVGAGQLGAHMLFDWGASKNIDVVDVWSPNAMYAPSALWTTACGSQVATKVWDLMSTDWNNDGKNSYPMVDGPFMSFNTNFNMMAPCAASCDDGNACTTDVCSASACVHTPVTCDDSDACTVDSCSAGVCSNVVDCVACPSLCNPCADEATRCNDGDACTVDSCNPTTGACIHTQMVCDDSSACTTDACVAGSCVFTPISCDDSNICTTDTCAAATGCVHTAAVPASCNDNSICTTDGCTANACTHLN